MHTVVETNAYLRAAKSAGMGADEQQAIVDLIAAHPELGEIMPGCGGARKLRVARPGGGKSGGYRVVTYFGGIDDAGVPAHRVPEERETNLTKAEQNAFAQACKRLTDSLGE